ncbi:MAG: choice-of-anchor T family protein [Candidatus Thalassarchaeaceae archaeon]|nr:choice-of-anchor T family protein [Candidatus Thalassarchaeaceae archaeon]MEE2629749.1 choice-of-anchor T family protein [Candidatus Thermoplasmatota archaeon]
MSTSFRVPLTILVVYFLSLLSGVAAVQAQTSPDVSLTCDQPQPIDVYPGSTRTTVIYCTLTNPTTLSEKVELTYQSGVIAVAGPGSATVPPGDTSFQVAARADLRMPEGQQVVTITGTVTQWGGAPVSGTTTPTEAKVLTVFKQFSRLRVGSELAFIQLRPKVDYTLVFDVYNDGNARDKFNVEIQNYDELNEAGFQLSLPLISQEIDSLAPPEKFRVQMRTPKNQGWTDKYFSLQFKATSEYSVRTEGIPNYQVQVMTIYIRGVYLPGFELVGTMMMAALAGAAVGKRPTPDEPILDEEGNLTPLETRLF